MENAYIDLNGVRTHVVTMGRRLQDASAANKPQDIILIITGNPGLVGFYRMFMHTIYEQLHIPVWCLGHAGHEEANADLPPLKGNEHLYNLEGQIQHKVAFIDKYVPENARLHLIGHSIGAYIILELLKIESINARTVDVKLLFPAIEHVAISPNGKLLSNFVFPIVWLIVFLSWIFTILPTFLRAILLYIYMRISETHKLHTRTIIQLVRPRVLERIFFMAKNYFKIIHERNDQIIKDNVEKITILYSETDGWAPKSYYDKIKEDIPNINAECSTFNHAFVLKQSRIIGKYIVEHFKKD